MAACGHAASLASEDKGQCNWPQESAAFPLPNQARKGFFKGAWKGDNFFGVCLGRA